MFAASFDYHRASSTAEALALLKQNPGAKLLAGGHSLIPMMKLRLAQPSALVDIGRVAELAGVSRSGDTLKVGALTRHADVAASQKLAVGCPFLAEAASHIADPQVRNRGTVGGNIAHADPASDLPAVLVAAGATVVLLGEGGERRVAARDFFVGLLTTDLRDGEVLTAVEIPALGPGTGSAYLKMEHPASGYALCGAAAVWTAAEGGRCQKASLAFNGIADVPVAADAVTDALAGSAGDDSTIEAAIDAAVEEHLAVEDPLSDVQASGEYRVALAMAYGKRALKRARERASGRG